MKLVSIYAAVVLIWSTTPLGIRFSVESLDFIQALAMRMGLSLVLCVVLLKVLRIPFMFSRAAFMGYGLGAIAVSGAMLCVYWAAQTLSSGLVSVMWGLTPLIVGIYGRMLLPNGKFGMNRLLCMGLAVLGLYIIFSQQVSLGEHMVVALVVLLLGINLQSVSSVLIQRLQAMPGYEPLHPLVQTTGALLLSMPAYGLVWFFFSGPLPEQVGWLSVGAVVYLATFGSVAGFIGYFYLLSNMSADDVSLITLITPVLALLLGTYVAGEQLHPNTWLGSLTIMLALLVNQQQQVRQAFKSMGKIRLRKA
ncbi:MAG: DMT family transporter [Bermanella sp.]